MMCRNALELNPLFMWLGFIGMYRCDRIRTSRGHYSSIPEHSYYTGTNHGLTLTLFYASMSIPHLGSFK